MYSPVLMPLTHDPSEHATNTESSWNKPKIRWEPQAVLGLGWEDVGMDLRIISHSGLVALEGRLTVHPGSLRFTPRCVFFVLHMPMFVCPCMPHLCVCVRLH